jgi:3'-phosphoadenosine 5'-phosphosulfate sulfotransferase (PAPS reductase)/FAD synthetase
MRVTVREARTLAILFWYTNVAGSYPIDVERIPSTDLPGSFTKYLQRHPQIQCIFVGVRRTDPFCADLHDFDATNNGWPAFIRCQPLLDWSYNDIWAYLRGQKFPIAFFMMRDTRHWDPQIARWLIPICVWKTALINLHGCWQIHHTSERAG